MKAVLKKIEKRDCKTKAGQKFSVIDYTCEVEVNDSGDIKILKGSMNIDYAKKYFEFCKITSKEAINKDVNVVIAKRKYSDSNGADHIVLYIKFLNFLDKDGNIIVMNTKKDEEDIGF